MDEYVSINKISGGTFSEVFKAKSKSTGKWVALKKIKNTSLPKRILKEIDFLLKFRGEDNVVKCEKVFRYNENVTIVQPFFEHDDFHKYFRKMNENDLKKYMKNLLIAIRRVHLEDIIHRDIKPPNFLHKFGTDNFLLIDFGLSQKLDELKKLSCKRKNFRKIKNFDKAAKTSKTDSVSSKSGISSLKTAFSSSFRSGQNEKKIENPTSVPFHILKRRLFEKKREKLDQLPQVSRCGTRGFRPPEVLLRTTKQTKGLKWRKLNAKHLNLAIDMWAVGVIMLSIVTRQYPVFYSPDDLTAMAEQICIFGNSYLDVAKKIYDRRIEMNFKTSEYCLTDLCRKLFKKNSSEKERFWSEKTLDLLEKLLELDFSKRITAEEALNHDFFK